MAQKITALLTVIFSISLAWLVSHSTRPDIEPPTRFAEPTSVDVSRLEELEVRLASLEQRLAESELVRGEQLRASQEDHDAPDIIALTERLARIEQSLAAAPPEEASSATSDLPVELSAREQEELERELHREQAERQHRQAERKAEEETMKKLAEGVITDPTARSLAKVESQGTIRQVPDAYTDEMIEELIRIAESDSEASIRADVWRYFDGATNIPALIDPLLHAMDYDSSDRVRAEAVETLVNYISDPAVLEIFRHIAENDPSVDVRRKALRELRELEQGG